MTDVYVTCPAKLWSEWIDEGQLPGEPWNGEEEYLFFVSAAPKIDPGERVYVVAHGKLRGYAPLVRVQRTTTGFALVRRGGAVAVTIERPIRGFQGFRYRDWERGEERPFPEWRA